MGTLTVRNIDDSLKSKLRLRAASHGRSMEEEMRVILRSALAEDSAAGDFIGRIRERFAELDDVELELPDRRDKARAAEFTE